MKRFSFLAPIAAFVVVFAIIVLAITGIAFAAEEEFVLLGEPESYHYGWSGEKRDGETVYRLKAKPGDEYLFVVPMPEEAGESVIDFTTVTITAATDENTVFDNLVKVDGRWTEENNDIKVAFRIKVPYAASNGDYGYHVVTENLDDVIVIDLRVDDNL